MTAPVRVKICGLTRPTDAEAAIESGAWALGVVLSASGPRAIGLERAAEVLSVAPPGVERVGVFVSPSPAQIAAAVAALPLTRIQVHGHGDRDAAAAAGLPLIRARSFASAADLTAIDPAPGELTLLDSAGPGGAGGTGERLDWETLARSRPPWPFVLAGGLTPENVADAAARTTPFAVDVSSGVESEPGIKDHARVLSFVQSAQGVGEPA